MHMCFPPVWTLCVQMKHLYKQPLSQFIVPDFSSRLLIHVSQISFFPTMQFSTHGNQMNIFQSLPAPDWSIWEPLQVHVLLFVSPCYFFFFFSLGFVLCSLETSNTRPLKLLWCISLKYTTFCYSKHYLFAVTTTCVLWGWDKVSRCEKKKKNRHWLMSWYHDMQKFKSGSYCHGGCPSIPSYLPL